MGKQIAIAMEYEDEEKFISFLKSESDIALIDSFSESIDSLWNSSFNKELTGHYMYYIWNKSFSWQPQYKQAATGLYYISNTYDAPLIEYSRSSVKEQKYGRIYWAKTFSAPKGLKYDVELFSNWYDDVIKWVKKNSSGRVKNGWITYFLPQAWNTYLDDANAH